MWVKDAHFEERLRDHKLVLKQIDLIYLTSWILLVKKEVS
jgi:hypothetical protein